MQGLHTIIRLGLKELLSFRRDVVMVVLVLYAFGPAVYLNATGAGIEVRNASVGVADEDRSPLSARLVDGLRSPFFLPAEPIELSAINRAMESGRYTFVINIPPHFEADVLAGRQPTVQVNVDATAMSQALNGTAYIQEILDGQVREFLAPAGDSSAGSVGTAIRVLFNPNLDPVWFEALMQLVGSITVLGVVITGAAIIREREHGTIDHLLVMPLRPHEIMLAKVWANALIILVATALSLLLVVQGVLNVPVTGSRLLYLGSALIYLFSITSIGIFLGTVARSMPQLGLLFLPVVIPMMMLSGGETPVESMPDAIRIIMMFSPSTHLVSLTTAVVFRGAGLDLVWPQLLAMGGIGVVFFAGALARFRRMLAVETG